MSEEIAAPPVEEQAPPPSAEEAAPAEPQVDADDDAAVEAATIEIPTGEKLVPLSALTSAREKAKALKADAARAKDLETQLEQLKGWRQTAEPYIEAARAMLEAQRQPAKEEPSGPTPEETAELQDIARDFDFYKADGSLDLDKAARQQKRTRAEAARIAQQQMQPVVERTLTQDAQVMLARAKATKLPNGETADPEMLDALWQRIAAQPGGLHQLANQESAKHLWHQAYAMTKVRQATQPAKPKAEPVGEPLFTEKAGGKETPGVTLNDGDRKVARDMGLTDAEYAKQVASMPWRRR